MNSIPDDELISAYLDDELSEEERARVEAMLLEQPEARQLLEDLRALRGGFEGLPTRRLDEAFVDRVMRSAEREMLAGDPPSVKVDHVEGEPTELRLASVERSHHALDSHRGPGPRGWQRFRRPLAWAAAAMAAGLLLMALDRSPQPPAPRGLVAQAPQGATPRDAEWGAPAADALARGAKLAESAPDDGQETGKSGDRAEESGAAFREKAEMRSAGEAKRPAPATVGLRSSATSPKSAVSGSAAPAVASDRSTDEVKGAPGAASKEMLQRRTFNRRLAKTVAPEGAAALNLFGVERVQNGKLVAEPLDEKTLIVWCDVDADVADRPEFRQLLAGNGIAWEPAGEQPERRNDAADAKKRLPERQVVLDAKEPSASLGAGKQKAAGAKPNAAAIDARIEADDAVNDAPPAREREATKDALQRMKVVADAVNEADSDYVLVEATSAQLKEVLEELDRRPQLFLSVNVEPAPAAPEQKAYAAYSRARAADEKAADKPREESDRKLAKQTQTMLGRAQRVMILPQLEQASELSVLGDKAQETETVNGTRAGALGGAARGPLQGKAASKDDKSAERARPLAAPAEKPAELAETEYKTAAPASGGESPDYQQALFIFRRVHPREAAPAPAKAEK